MAHVPLPRGRAARPRPHQADRDRHEAPRHGPHPSGRGDGVRARQAGGGYRARRRRLPRGGAGDLRGCPPRAQSRARVRTLEKESPMRLLWGECTWEDIAQAAREDYLVVFPAGAIEQHGPMLPVDVDARLAERYAADGAQRARDKYGLNVLVLPTLPYGQSFIHMKFPGTISFSFETYLAALSDILRTVADWGFRALMICNGNGGNEQCLEVARRKLTEEMTRANREVRFYLQPGWNDSYFQS